MRLCNFILSSIIGVFSLVAMANPLIGDGMTRVHDIQAGESIENAIRVTNTSKEEPLELKFFASDYHFSGGNVRYPEPGTLPRSCAGWISFTPTRSVLRAGETIQLEYRVEVPAEGVAPGTYWSLVLVEPVVPAKPEQEDETDDFDVRIVNRLAIQIVINVGEQPAPKVKYVAQEVRKTDDGKFYSVSVENTGETWVRPEVWAEFFDSDGQQVGRFPVKGIKRIYPTCSLTYDIPIGDLGAGEYTAIVVVDCGEDAFAGQYSVTLD